MPPQGTGRSRNRTGGRPNYAEDKELDLEIEALSKPSRVSKRFASAADQQPPVTAAMTVDDGALPEQVTEHPPPVAAPAPSKKRKHPGSNHTVSTPTAAAVNPVRARPSASVPFKGYIETNMMSFLRCGSKLNAKRQLAADDGTTIQANGNLSSLIYAAAHHLLTDI